MSDSTLQDELRRAVKEWKTTTGQNQSDLATLCGVDNADLAHFLRGRRRLPDFALTNLAHHLGIDPSQLLLQWATANCNVEIAKLHANESATGKEAKVTGWERARDAYDDLLERLPSHESSGRDESNPGSLAEWPEAFLPMVVFVGDRRESPPSSPADLLAVSASLGDLFYFSRLNLPQETEIRSDKTCVVATPENLRKLLQDKHILVIGSPAANLVAREVNRGACFSFYATPEAIVQEKTFKALLDPIRYFPGELERYAGVNSDTAEHQEWSRRRRHMIYGFARSGILDPVHYEGARATSTPAHADYGVVTMCKHPWSETHTAVMAAGLHGPATAAAVKLLSQRKAFEDRPLGGVFRVHVPIDAPWEERYHHLNPEWDTHPYTLAEYLADFNSFLDKYPNELNAQLKFWEPPRVASLLNLVSPARTRIS